MVSFKPICPFLTLTWIGYTIAATTGTTTETGPYRLVNKGTNQAISVTSQDGVLKTVPATGAVSPDETFKFLDYPNFAVLIESVKYPKFYFSCTVLDSPCVLNSLGTTFYQDFTDNGVFLRNFQGNRFVVTGAKEGNVILSTPGNSTNELFDIVDVK